MDRQCARVNIREQLDQSTGLEVIAQENVRDEGGGACVVCYFKRPVIVEVVAVSKSRQLVRGGQVLLLAKSDQHRIGTSPFIDPAGSVIA